MMNFPRHESYKDSGVEWLGEVPEDWEVTRVKNVFRLIAEPAHVNNDFELLSVYTDIGVKPRKELEEKGNKASTTDGYWLVKKDDIIVNKLLAWMGAIGVSKYDGVTSPAYDILRAKRKLNSDFYHYLFRTESCVSELKKHSRGIMEMRLRLYFDKFGDVLIPFPDFDEQQRIVKFLDRRTAQIDEAIDKKEKLIALLKERRQILTRNAVTRGLNPNVKMKDSGVEWIGEIPEHWEVKRLKNVCEMLVSNVDKHSKSFENQVKLCNYVDVYKNEFITSEIEFMSATATRSEIERFKIQIDDVIITKDSEDWLDIGVPALVKYEEENLVCGYHLAILRPTDFMFGGFFHRALSSIYIRTQFSIKANGVTRYGISHGAILGTFIAVPPKSEQITISQYIENVSAKIETAISCKQKEIEKLKEYKAVLINSAVTGKIKVEG
jgi:type I restriction enzyme S subunit